MQNDRVGKYRIIAKLGQGGMASVFLSVVPGPAGFNKLLVVKLLKEELVHDPDFLSMFLNEARLAARLNHANVVHTYEVGVDGDQHFLVMDYLDGQPLHAILRRVRRERMPLDVHVRILADMLAGLHYAHTLTDFDGTPLHVVHRDVSPQNVFVTYDGQVKVVDFGIAKAAGATSTTQSGVFKGKMSYVAPEQAGGDTIDARADVFSVGVMLWEAMAGRKFAQGDGQGAVLARRLAGAEPRIREVVPDADPELADICDRAMAHKKEDRYASAQDFRDALEGFLERFSRRIGAREVGEFVTQMFAEERAQIRQIIDEQMKRVMRETSQALPLPTLDMHQGSGDPTPLTSKNLLEQTMRERIARGHGPLPIGHDSQPSSASISHGTLATAHISQAPPAANTNRTILLVLGLLAAVSVIGVVFVAFLQKPGATTASANAATAAPSADAAPEQITITIEYGPPGAIAKLDGVTLGESPFTAKVPRDGTLHQVEVEGPGLVPQKKAVTYDKDVSLIVTLSAEAAASATAEPTAPARVAGPLRTGTKPPPPDTTSTKPPKTTRIIDEQDPYKK
jgi:serine/threonine-protein kinase